MRVKNFLFASIMSFAIYFCAVAGIANNYSNVSENYHGTIADETLMYSVYSSAISHYDNSMEAYFDNLTKNFGQNYKGSCGYVALGMMLSYYDTYLNDDIIPEQYDIPSSGEETNMVYRRKSPGILRDIISDPNDIENTWKYPVGLSPENYYSLISAMSGQSLHAKLITIGGENGYYNVLNYTEPCLTSFNSRKQILECYLDNIVNLTKGSQYDIDYIVYDDYTSHSEEVKNYIIAKIKSGYPVLIGVQGKSGGHVCVAYDYDGTSDTIYCHMGWGASTTHVSVESQGYNYYDSAMIIDFNLEHKHSDNYEVLTFDGSINTKKYCPCSSEITVYNPHSFSYENTDENYHTYTCDCGLTKTEKHSYTLYSVLSGMIGSLKHNVECVCGTSKKQMHTLVTQKIGSESYTYCTKCFWSRIDKENGAFNYNIIDFKEFVKSLAE